MKNYHNVKVYPPEGYEIDKASIIDNTVVVTFKKVNEKPPKSWEEFCEMFPKYGSIFYIDDYGEVKEIKQVDEKRYIDEDKTTFPDRPTAEAVLSLCQLIQLRDCYNGDWVPDWSDYSQVKYYIYFSGNIITKGQGRTINEILHFKSEELRNEFLRNFRPLIEKLKPLYGIKKGGKDKL